MHQRRRKISGPHGPKSGQFDEAHAGQERDSANSFFDRLLVNVIFVEDMFPT